MTMISSICRSILDDYCSQVNGDYRNLWRWPRETDLVAELVSRANIKLGTEHLSSPGKLVKRNTNVALKNDVQLPAVRTEVKLLEFDRPWKIDVCLMKENASAYLENKKTQDRIRDVGLSVAMVDVAEILEVKLDPHPDLAFLGDLLKLREIQDRFSQSPIAMHLLSIDTDLVPGLPYSSHNSPIKSRLPLRALDESLKYPVNEIPVKMTKGKSLPRNEINLIPCTNGEIRSGIYLWGLLGDIGENRQVKSISPGCWEVAYR